LKDTLL